MREKGGREKEKEEGGMEREREREKEREELYSNYLNYLYDILLFNLLFRHINIC